MKRSILDKTPPSNAAELWPHISDTYLSIRKGLLILTLSFPFVLAIWGSFLGLELQSSMSAYFFATTKEGCAHFPMRTYFVGFLFAIGAGLYAYKGFTNRENLLLNIAAFCAICVAIFPEQLDPKDLDPGIQQLLTNCPAIKDWAEQPKYFPNFFPETALYTRLHFFFAGLLFLLLAVVALHCAEDSLEFLPKNSKPGKAWFQRMYRGIGGLMLLILVAGFVMVWGFGKSNSVFYFEAAAVLTFGGYWWVKTRELSLSKIEGPDSSGA